METSDFSMVQSASTHVVLVVVSVELQRPIESLEQISLDEVKVVTIETGAISTSSS